MNTLIKIATLVLVVLFTGCTTTSILKEQQYRHLYEEQPVAIAIMPPINRTPHVEAKEFFYTTLYAPLCERGYYAFSPYLIQELFQEESASDAEQFIDGDLSNFGRVLGADALMFTVIKDWKRVNLSARITVQVEYILKSTKTNAVLFRREGTLTVDNSINTGMGLLANLAASFIHNAAQDKVVAGRLCSRYILKDLPAGKYSPKFGLDKQEKAALEVVKAVVKQQ